MNNPATGYDRREATTGEVKTLPHVVDSLPFIVWVALMLGAAERFTFYAVATPWQNYIQNSPDDIAVPGALGLGQVTATNISNAFYFFSLLTPIPFGIVSDMWLGRYKTLVVSFLWVLLSPCTASTFRLQALRNLPEDSLNLSGCLVLFVTSLPMTTQNSGKITGLSLSMVLLGLGTGGVKATMSPFIGDQYTTMTSQLIVRKNGERVITDRTLTLQYIYNVFYWFTNIGGLSLIVATYLEEDVGFWAAYLLPLCSLGISIPLLMFWRKSFVKLAPQDNVLPQAAKVIMYSAQHQFRLDAAKPAFQAEQHGRHVPWDDHFVSEIERGLKACQVMSCFVLFYVCLSQMSTNLVSQAGQMQLGSVPNDMLQAFNGISCVILGPLIQNILYPTLRKHGIAFKPITRMACSFVAMSTAMAYAAGIQKLIYSTGPCYSRPLACPASVDGSIPNNVTVWMQIPVYFLLALAEVLGFTTLSEYSYSEAPKDMRSLVQGLRQVIAAVASALALALSQAAKDPKVLYLYTGLAATMILSAPIFWVAFRSYDSKETQPDGESERQPSREVTEI